jgi:hypothetical protein
MVTARTHPPLTSQAPADSDWAELRGGCVDSVTAPLASACHTGLQEVGLVDQGGAPPWLLRLQWFTVGSAQAPWVAISRFRLGCATIPTRGRRLPMNAVRVGLLSGDGGSAAWVYSAGGRFCRRGEDRLRGTNDGGQQGLPSPRAVAGARRQALD